MSKARPKTKVTDYIKGVLDNTIIAGRYQRLAVERHIKDLERKKFPYSFNEDAAIKAYSFFEKYLHHSKGQWAGKKFELLSWEAFVTWVLFGWQDDAGFRRFRTAFLEMARKQGKSTYASGIGNYLLFNDNEPGAEIYSVATKLDQAKIVHEEAVKMVRSSPELLSFARILHNKITVPRIDGKYQPLGADSKTLDGLNISGAIADETHAWPSRELWDVVQTATGSRRQPLLLAISTSGYDKESFGYELRNYAARVLDNLVEDERFFSFICTLDEGDDWKDPGLWIKANPSLDVTVELKELKEQFKTALSQPSFENSFKRYRLNLWTEQRTRWIGVEKWDLCIGDLDVNDPVMKESYFEQLKGKDCIAGLDLAKTSDLCALCLIFPEDPYIILPYFWIPREKMLQKIRTDHVRYDVWEKQGFIEPTEGDATNYDYILQRLKECCQDFNVLELAYDPYNSSHFIQQLEDEIPDLVVVPVSQGIKKIAPAVKSLEQRVLNRQLVHGGHPVLRWNFSNIMAIEDLNENVKFDKQKSTGRIDGISATVTGLARLIDAPINQAPYGDGRDLLILSV